MEEKRYKIICCNCGEDIYATKSIFHQMGMLDLGHGRCCYCNTSLQLIYNPDNDTMSSKLFDEFVKEKESKMK
jgi:hypothetical protein